MLKFTELLHACWSVCPRDASSVRLLGAPVSAALSPVTGSRAVTNISQGRPDLVVWFDGACSAP